MKAFRLPLLAACAAFMLGGCTAAFMDTAARGIFPQEEVNMTAKNQAAADYMIQQAETFLTKGSTLVEAVPLRDVQQPDLPPARLGMMIPEQVGIRLAQLGYRMDLDQVLTSADRNFMRPAIRTGEEADYTLSGTYLRRRKDIYISLRIAGTQSGRVIASFDYTIPMNKEINQLSEPKTQIFRVQE
jgi:hypothetical protein